MRVLIIDDEEDTRSLASMSLTILGEIGRASCRERV